MASIRGQLRRPAGGGTVKSMQDLGAGLVLLLLALLALWLTRDLAQGTLDSVGPAMLPRGLAVALGLCGVALVTRSFLSPSDALEGWDVRGMIMITLGITGFALTIRSFPFGGFTSPGLGLLVAGPLSILIAGFATREATLRERLVLALGLTAFCMLLFADLLNLPVPLYPNWLQEQFPAAWSPKTRLRIVAATLALAAALIGLTGKRSDDGRRVA